MARLVKFEGTGPKPITLGNETKYICTCGLTKNSPFCDGNHNNCKGEDTTKLYRYNQDGTREEINL